MQQQLQRRPAGQGLMRSRQPLRVRADATARVKGTPSRVGRYIADVRHWTSWYPGTKSAVKLGNGLEPIRPGAKFETTRDMLGVKLPMTYEVLESDPKRLVLSGLSEHHTQMDQFFFMADRHDPNWCCVRYITDVRLREWRVYMQPLAARFAAKVPEEAMASLQRTLNASTSPIFSHDFDSTYRQELRSSSGSRASPSGSKAGSRAGSRSGTTGTRAGGAAPKSSLSSGWLKNMFSGGARSNGNGSSNGNGASSSGRLGSEQVVVLDPMGYYDLLGLSPHTQLDDDELKAAYRRLAMQLHPDRHMSKGEAERAAAAARFAQLLKAYDTLRDPQARALYAAGQLVEASLDL